MVMPATCFPFFGLLPKELRLKIWEHALPGPRIILVERFIDIKDEEQDNSGEGHGGPPQTSVTSRSARFSSPSSSHSVVRMLGVCKELNEVVKRRYSIIFPLTSTWFDFDVDFLFINGGSAGAAEYDIKYPDFGLDIVIKTKNLLVCDYRVDGFWISDYKSVARRLSECFPALEVLVFVDQIYHHSDLSEELVLLNGILGSGFYRNRSCESYALENWESMFCLKKLLLFEDTSEYGFTSHVNVCELRREWDSLPGTSGWFERDLSGRSPPAISRNSVISATLKSKLVEICGSEEGIKSLEQLDSRYVLGDILLHPYHWREPVSFELIIPDNEAEKYEYTGSFTIAQQLAYLGLVLARIDLMARERRPRMLRRFERLLLARINQLMEPELQKLRIKEAEDLI